MSQGRRVRMRHASVCYPQDTYLSMYPPGRTTLTLTACTCLIRLAHPVSRDRDIVISHSSALLAAVGEA